MADDTNQAPIPLGEIDHGPSKTEEFLENHQKSILIGACLVAALVVLYIVVSGVKQTSQETAGHALISADDDAGLAAVISDHSGSNAAGSAHLLLADSLWKENKKDEAIAQIQTYLSDYPDHSARSSASAKLGSFLLRQGKLDEAKAVLEPLTSNEASAYVAPFALNLLGDIAKAQGNVEVAKLSYERSAADYANRFDNTTESDSQLRLGLLEFEAPKEVEPPTAPETPELGSTTPPIPVPAAPAVTTSPIEVPATPAPEAEVVEAPEVIPAEEVTPALLEDLANEVENVIPAAPINEEAPESDQ